MTNAFQIEVGENTLKALAALTRQLELLNKNLNAAADNTTENDWLTMQEFTAKYKISAGTVYARVQAGAIEQLRLSDKVLRYRIKN